MFATSQPVTALIISVAKFPTLLAAMNLPAVTHESHSGDACNYSCIVRDLACCSSSSHLIAGLFATTIVDFSH